MKLRARTVLGVVFRGREFLVLHRTPGRGAFWQPVTGRIKKKETAIEAAQREVEEETGLRVRRVFPIEGALNIWYEPDRDAIYFEPAFGAEVGPGEVRLSREHDDYRWATLAETIRLLRWPGNQHAVRMLGQTLRET